MFLDCVMVFSKHEKNHCLWPLKSVESYFVRLFSNLSNFLIDILETFVVWIQHTFLALTWFMGFVNISN